MPKEQTTQAAIATERRAQKRITVQRRPEFFSSDDSRVITRFFGIGGEDRMRRIIDRVLSLPQEEVDRLLLRIDQDFEDRHRDIDAVFDDHFEKVAFLIHDTSAISLTRKRLIGAYFTLEYSVESAALFNPSMVPHPNQKSAKPGDLRFLMSLRATGEGHVSSIVFRTGVAHADGSLSFDKPGKLTSKLHVLEDKLYEKKLFFYKLIEMGAYTPGCQMVLDELDEHFTLHELEQTIADIQNRPNRPNPFSEIAENMRWLAHSNYALIVPKGTKPSEIVIFPSSENESRGIEDVRLTRFIEDDGSITYFGTYTAYNGFRILPQLIETSDFQTIEVHTLNGKYAQNKGMALFPRRINGFYMMIGRLDGENLYLMQSDNVHFWNEAHILQTPLYAWEFVQIGNCGPPIETDQGWLLLTHGVGPMRQYCIGALLLDLEDPSKVIGHLKHPLIIPREEERDGYVPNVVYSCGGLVHNNTLILPYAMSDSASSFATVDMNELLEELITTGSP